MMFKNAFQLRRAGLRRVRESERDVIFLTEKKSQQRKSCQDRKTLTRMVLSSLHLSSSSSSCVLIEFSHSPPSPSFITHEMHAYALWNNKVTGQEEKIYLWVKSLSFFSSSLTNNIIDLCFLLFLPHTEPENIHTLSVLFNSCGFFFFVCFLSRLSLDRESLESEENRFIFIWLYGEEARNMFFFCVGRRTRNIYTQSLLIWLSNKVVDEESGGSGEKLDNQVRGEHSCEKYVPSLHRREQARNSHTMLCSCTVTHRTRAAPWLDQASVVAGGFVSVNGM